MTETGALRALQELWYNALEQQELERETLKIDTTIVDAYLSGEDVSKFSSLWFYTDRREDGVGNIFQAPPAVEVKRDIVSHIK